MMEDGAIKDLAVNFAADILKDHKDGIYVVRFPTKELSVETVAKFIYAVSETLSSKKVIAIPDAMSIQEMSKDALAELAERIQNLISEQ